MTPQRTWDLPKTLAKIDRCSPQIKIPTPGVQIEASRPCGRVRIQESGGGPKILQQEQDGSPKTLLQQEQDGQTTPKRSGTPKNLSPDWPLVDTPTPRVQADAKTLHPEKDGGPKTLQQEQDGSPKTLLLLFSACLDVLLAIELSFLGLVCMDCMNFRWSVQLNLIEKEREIKYSYTFASLLDLAILRKLNTL